jgi:antitoxin CptB
MTEPKDALSKRRKRLLYQSRHRGTQEADLLIGNFAERYLPTMTDAQLDLFEQLLDENDVDLVNWITGRAAVPAGLESEVLELLKNFKLDIVRS